MLLPSKVCQLRLKVLILTREHEGLRLRGKGCDLHAKGRGDAFVPDDLSIGVGRKFRTAQMIAMQEGNIASRYRRFITVRFQKSLQLGLKITALLREDTVTLSQKDDTLFML